MSFVERSTIYVLCHYLGGSTFGVPTVIYIVIAERLSARHCIAHSGQDRQQVLYVCMYVCISSHAFGMQLVLQ